MRSIAEKKAHRAAIMRKYQSKPESKARKAAYEMQRRDAKRTTPKRKAGTSIIHLSDQEKRARRAAQQRTRIQLKRAVSPLPVKRSEEEKREQRNARRRALRAAERKQPFFSRAGLSDPEKRDRRAAQMRQWVKDNKTHARYLAQSSYQNRRARKLHAVGSFTRGEWKFICAQYDYRCLCCNERRPLCADHVVPLSKGGANDIANIQPLCRSCNSRKGTKTIDYRR